jgi:hypothetical protein
LRIFRHARIMSEVFTAVFVSVYLALADAFAIGHTESRRCARPSMLRFAPLPCRLSGWPCPSFIAETTWLSIWSKSISYSLLLFAGGVICPAGVARHFCLLARLVPGRRLVQSGKEQFRRGGRADRTIDYDVLRGGSFSVEPLVAIVIGTEG